MLAQSLTISQITEEQQRRESLAEHKERLKAHTAEHDKQLRNRHPHVNMGPRTSSGKISGSLQMHLLRLKLAGKPSPR